MMAYQEIDIIIINLLDIMKSGSFKGHLSMISFE